MLSICFFKFIRPSYYAFVVRHKEHLALFVGKA
jgi:hypothetical protein